jgi:phosphoglycolate phosphatase-like HAD superfamily hydrolase
MQASDITGSARRPKAVIFDMDGTLADVSGLRHLVQRPKPDFRAFHERSVDAPPHDYVVAMAREARDAGLAVVIVTARSVKYRNHTAFWLAMHGVPSDALYMRAETDYRPDFEVKRDILVRLSARFSPIRAVDDNPNVLHLWEQAGLEVTRIPGWDAQ